MSTFRKSVMDQQRDSYGRVQASDTVLNVSEPDQEHEVARSNSCNSTDTTDDAELVRKGYEYFKKFKGLIVDMTYSFVDRDESRRYFLSSTPEDALTVIEVELSFIYDYFFTKASVVRTKVGYICRLASFSSILVALLVFFFDKKHGFSKFDVRVTYVLLLGAVGLEFVALWILIFSDWITFRGTALIKHFLRLKKSKWPNDKKESYTKFKALSTNPLFRRWSGTISGYDLVTYWIRQRQEFYKGYYMSEMIRKERNPIKLFFYKVTYYIGAKERKKKGKGKENNPFTKELWEFIFSELQRKSKVAEDAEMVKKICEATGGWIIQESELEERVKGILMAYFNANETSFDETLIMWHIATGVCYYADADSDQNVDHRYFSKILSDYMLYLLEMEPAIMSTVAGIGQQRIIEIISSLEKISSKVTNYISDIALDEEKLAQSACERLVGPAPPDLNDFDVKEGRRSVYENALLFANVLRTQPAMVKWKITAQVWVEMLSYAAINCRPDAIVQQLSKGGQRISFVWLLTLHFGLGSRQFKNQA